MIKSITPVQTNIASLYEGPTGLEGWTNGNQENGWKYKDGTFYTHNNGILGRDFKLPDMSNIEFDMGWAGYLQIVISVYTDQTENYGGNCYILQMNNNYVYLERMRRNSGSSNLGQTELQSLMQRSKARIGIRVNKQAKTISLLVDGTMAKQWTDRGDFAGAGGGVAFYSQGRGLIKISNVRITAWDGKFEENKKPDDKSSEDTIKLANQDKVSGSLKSIEKGVAILASSYATLKIPVERIEEIDIAGKNADQARHVPGDVRAFFTGRGTVTLSVEKWDEKQLIGSSPNFGRVTFAPAAFDRLQFNLDQQAQNSEDPDSDAEPDPDQAAR